MPLFGKSAEKLCLQGEKLMAKGLYEEAIEKFGEAIELGKDNLVVRCVAELNMGVCYARLNNKEKAMEHNEKAIELVKMQKNLPAEEPEDEEEKERFYKNLFSHEVSVQAYFNKGIVMRAMDKLEESREIFDNLIKYVPWAFRVREPIFRMERFETIVAMVEKEKETIPGLIPVNYIEEQYRKLGYNKEEMDKDFKVVHPEQ